MTGQLTTIKTVESLTPQAPHHGFGHSKVARVVT